MRASPSGLFGLGSRAGASRLDRLQATSPAKKLKTLIDGLDRTQLQRLLVYGEVNHDQALPTGTILLPVVIALAIVVSILWFASAGVDAARDLNHLLRLSLAQAARPAGEDDEALDTLEMITDLTRRSQTSPNAFKLAATPSVLGFMSSAIWAWVGM